MNEFFPKSNGNQSYQTQETNPVVNNNLENKGEKNRTIEGNNDATTQKEKLSQTGRPYPSLDSPEAQEMIKNAETINFTVHPLYDLLYKDLDDIDLMLKINSRDDDYHKLFLKSCKALLQNDQCHFQEIFMIKMQYLFNLLRNEINQGMKVSGSFTSMIEFFEEFNIYSKAGENNNEITIFHLPNYNELNTYQKKAIISFLKSLPKQNQIITINSQMSNNGVIIDHDKEKLRILLEKGQEVVLRGGYTTGCVSDASDGISAIQKIKNLHIDYVGTTGEHQIGFDLSKYFQNALSPISKDQQITPEFIHGYLIKNRQVIDELHKILLPILNQEFDDNKDTTGIRSSIYKLPFKNHTPEDIEKWLDDNIKEMK